MIKSIGKWIIVCFILAVFLFMSNYSQKMERWFYESLPIVQGEGKNSWMISEQVVGHASGGIESMRYTNSLEALTQTINSGVKVIEVDFNYTNDKELVCYHTLYDLHCDVKNDISFIDFMSLRIQGRYSPMTFEDVVNIMRQNPHIYIALDTKYSDLIEMVEDVYNRCKDKDILNRLIIQLYYPNQKEKIQEIYDFPNMLFAPYKYSENPYDTLKVCYRENINAVVVNYKSWSFEVFRLFKEKGINVYTYTVNREDIADKLLSNGVYGIYTDFLLDYKSKY